VTKNTVDTLREGLDMTDEEAIAQCALASFQDSASLLYEADDGPVPEMMFEHIRASIPQDIKGGKSLFDGV